MNKCSNCRLAICDIIAAECLLKPTEVAKLRPDLIKPLTKYQAHYRRYKHCYRSGAKAWRDRNPEKAKAIARNQWAKHKDAINQRRRAKYLERTARGPVGISAALDRG